MQPSSNILDLIKTLDSLVKMYLASVQFHKKLRIYIEASSVIEKINQSSLADGSAVLTWDAVLQVKKDAIATYRRRQEKKDEIAKEQGVRRTKRGEHFKSPENREPGQYVHIPRIKIRDE